MTTRAVIWCAVSTRAQNSPEKISLPQQEEEARLLAQQSGWQIVDILRVPGHSRRYLDFHEVASHAAKEGIDAFNRLKTHWESKDFDVLIVRDGDRFARTQALHAYVTENIIDSGAVIYSLQDGRVDSTNHRLWIAMSGYKAAGEIDRLVKARDDAMTNYAKIGKPISSRIALSHRILRDEKSGKAIRLEVDERKRRMWDDLAQLILEGVAWVEIEIELYKRYGHVNEAGVPYYPNKMYRLIMKPMFWGHMARFHNNKDSLNGFKCGRWVYDEGVPAPEGVLIFRNTHPAVWTGEVADKVKQEIDRRSVHMRGSAHPARSHMMTGLIICGECGSFLATHVDKGYRAVYCPAAKHRAPTLPDCRNRGVCNQHKVVDRLNEYLRQMLEAQSADIFADSRADLPSLQRRLAKLDSEIMAIETQVRVAIRKQVSAPEEVQGIFDEEIRKLSEQLKVVREARARQEGETLAAQQNNSVQQIALEELTTMTLERFWKKENRFINQTLHRLMGKRRLVMLDHEIVGVVEVNRRQRRHA